jgi:GTP-binding protein
VLIHLVEPDPMDGTDPIENYRAIREELKLYDVDLAARPELIAVSKAELPGAAEIRDKLSAEIGKPVMLFSAVTGQGLNELVRSAYQLLAQERQGT